MVWGYVYGYETYEALPALPQLEQCEDDDVYYAIAACERFGSFH